MESDVATAPLTAEERRQRRMKRILENSESRINTILSGPGGDEKRNAPAMEGGEGFNLPTPSTSTSPVTANSPPPPTTVRKESTLLKFCDQKRRHISFFTGILCRLVMLVTGFQANVIIPWIILYITTEMTLMRHIRSSTALPDEMLAFMRTMSGGGGLPFDISYLVSALTLSRELMKDTTFMVAGFVLSQYAMVLFDFYL